jgi:acetylornithine deacetylase/succinyl-diaminopimelate desuccinylase-like protein
MNEKHLELLKQLISIPSPSTKEHRIAEFISNWFEERGFDVTQLDVDVNGRKAGPTVLATFEFNKPGKSLLFAGHMDTVEPVSAWKTDPYTPVIQEGRLYGLGAYDMKSGIAALMLAAEKLSRMKVGGKIGCCLVSDFEAFSTGTYVVCKSGLIDGYDGGILPDEYMERFANPLTEAATILSRLSEFGRRMMNPMAVQGGLEHLYPSVPETCQIIIDAELLPEEAPEDAIEKMRCWIGTLDLQSDISVKAYDRPTPWMRPYNIQPDEPILQCLEEVCSKHDIELLKISTSYVADNYYVNVAGIPMLYAIGPVGANCHAAGEYVVIDSVDKCSQLMVEVGKSFLA